MCLSTLKGLESRHEIWVDDTEVTLNQLFVYAILQSSPGRSPQTPSGPSCSRKSHLRDGGLDATCVQSTQTCLPTRGCALERCWNSSVFLKYRRADLWVMAFRGTLYGSDGVPAVVKCGHVYQQPDLQTQITLEKELSVSDRGLNVMSLGYFSTVWSLHLLKGQFTQNWSFTH